RIGIANVARINASFGGRQRQSNAMELRFAPRKQSERRTVRRVIARQRAADAGRRTRDEDVHSRKIGCAARLLCRVLARPSLYLYVLSRGSLRAFAYSGCSPHFEIPSNLRLSSWNARRAPW